MPLQLKQISYHLLLLWAVINMGFAVAVSLEENSPFIPYDYNQTATPSISPPMQNFIELHGILDFGKVPKFSLYNSKTQKSMWVALNDKHAPFLIDSYDPEKKVVAITINGVRQQLEISKPFDENKNAPSSRSPGPSRALNEMKARFDRDTGTRLDSADEEEEDEEDGEDEEEEDVEEMSDEEQAQRRREMSERVYRAFQQYVSERRGENPTP